MLSSSFHPSSVCLFRRSFFRLVIFLVKLARFLRATEAEMRLRNHCVLLHLYFLVPLPDIRHWVNVHDLRLLGVF